MPDDFFLTHAWFDTLLAHGLEHPPRSVSKVQLVDTCGHLLGLLPLMQVSTHQGLVSVSNYYTGVYGPVAARWPAQWTSVDWAGCAAKLAQLPGSAVIQLQPLDAESDFLLGLRQGLRASGYATDCFHCFGNWYLPVADGDTFKAYWAGRPSRLRSTVERAQKKLVRHHTWHVDVIQQPGESLEAGIQAYLQVYAASWKPPEVCADFMPQLLRMAAASDNLRLGVLWLDGAPMAAQVWLVHGGKANIFKLAYLPGHEKLSLGSVLTAHLMQHVIDIDRVTEVDFLSGDDAYKPDWMSHRRERVGLIAFDLRRAQGLVAALRHGAGRAWRYAQQRWQAWRQVKSS